MLTALFFGQLPIRKALLVVFFATSIWGVLWIPLRWLDAVGISELWASFTFVAIPVLPLCYFGWHRVRASLHLWRVYLLVGGCIGAGFCLYCTGLVVGSVTRTVLLFYLTPIWASILGILFLAERASLGRWLTNVLGVIGCGLVLGISNAHLTLEASDALGFFAGVVWALGVVLMRRFPDADSLGLVLSQYMMGTLLMLGALAVIGTPAPTWEAWQQGWLIAAITAAVFLPSMMLISRISQYVSPGLVGLLMLSEVLLAMLSAMLLLGERLIGAQWLGAGCIVLTALAAAFLPDRDYSDGDQSDE